MSEYQRWKGIMKCVAFEEKRLAKWQPPFIVQPKYDGDRCKAYHTPGGYFLVSSEENPFGFMDHITDSLNRSGLNLTLDGELYNHELCKAGGHELIHSIVSRKVNPHPQSSSIQFHVFDIESPDDQLGRMNALLLIKELKIPNVIISPFWLCDTLDDIKDVYDQLINLGYEGIIVRNIYNYYQHKRSTMLMKFKPKRSDTYKIIGFGEEISINGVPKNQLGFLTLSSQTGDSFKVSAGLTTDEKQYLWSIKEELIGLDCTVFYQHLTNAGIPKGTFDLQIPEKGIL